MQVAAVEDMAQEAGRQGDTVAEAELDIDVVGH